MFDLSREGAATNDQVAAAFAEALTRDPNNPTLLAEAGNAAWIRGDITLAQQCLDRGIELDPNQANLRRVAGLVAMSQGQFEEAAELFPNGVGSKLAWRRRCALAGDDRLGRVPGEIESPTDAEVITRQVVNRHADWPAPLHTRLRIWRCWAVKTRRSASTEN